MSDDIECPYCDEGNEHDSEQADPLHIHEMQCRHCEKNFIFYVEYSPSFREHKADCLNGAPHKWKDLLGNDEYQLKHYEMRQQCEWCDKLEYKLKAKP